MPFESQAPQRDPYPPLIGVSTLLRKLYRREDVTGDWNGLVARYKADALDASALLDISLILHTTGQMEKGLGAQTAAVEFRRVFRRVFGTGTKLEVICFVIEGDMTANTPVDFLLEGSDCTLHYAYVRADDATLPALPDADIAIMAIGESPRAQPVLATLGALLAQWNGPPVVNGDTHLIAAMTRDELHERLASQHQIVSPTMVRTPRATVMRVAEGGLPLGALFEAAQFPLLLRPVGTHAAEGLEKIEEAADLKGFLSRTPGDVVYCSQYLDYRSADGHFRKYRIVFVEGRPFAGHMAISDNWMVHYVNAGMSEHAERRAEEALWMAHFDEDFARRHAEAFDALCRIVPLDYFGIDCAELPDGRLIVFELDNIMIIHDMDPPELFPYKQPAMRRVFEAFQKMLTARALSRSPSASAEAPSRHRSPA